MYSCPGPQWEQVILKWSSYWVFHGHFYLRNRHCSKINAYLAIDLVYTRFTIIIIKLQEANKKAQVSPFHEKNMTKCQPDAVA